MVSIGYSLMCEQSGPRQLVGYAARAEEAGFDFAVISDHYNPWLASQGHSPYAWSVLGAAAHATSRVGLMSFVTCPIQRYHPTVVAQKAATMGVLSDGRFTLGVGAGENLNEHVAGQWPHVQQRHEMLAEALEIIQPLLAGESLRFSGEWFDVPEAYLWDRPARTVPVAVAASGPSSARLAGELGDALVTVEPDPQVLADFDAAGGAGKPRYGQAALCYGFDEAACRALVYDQFRWNELGWPVNSELPDPEAFASATRSLSQEAVAQAVPCGPDLNRHVEVIARYVSTGYTHVALVQVGDEGQPAFLDWAQRELLPALRELG